MCLDKTWSPWVAPGMNDRNYKRVNDILLHIIKTPINIHHEVQKMYSLLEAVGLSRGLRSELKMMWEEQRKGNTLRKFGIIILPPVFPIPCTLIYSNPHPKWKQNN